jgi:glycosyltransferase involved in cell wall biosynthesis
VKVAYFSPLPPERSGIADYSALLLPSLEARVTVEIVRPGRTRPSGDADVAIYHVGNDPDSHGWIVDALRRRPGVVVLHDFVLHHLVAGLTIGRRNPHAYLAAMERDSGVPGRLLGHGVLEGRVPPLWEVRPEEFPLAGEVLDLATGLIVHSAYVEARAREAGYEGPLWRIPHPAWPRPDVAPAAIEGAPLIGSFGHQNESKRIPQLLEAFARLRERCPEARLLLVGPEAPGFDLAGRIERLGLTAEGVIREPYVEEQRLWSLMAAVDGVVALRSPTMGETSGSVIRALSLGRPLVVSDLGWFAELPDEVALKVPVGGEAEVEALAAALEQLAEPERRERMAAAALELARREHDVGAVADAYVTALEEAAGGRLVREQVLAAIAAAAAEVEVDPAPLAAELVEAGLVGPDGHVPVSDTGPGLRWTRLVARVPVWAWLGGMIAVSSVVRFLLGRRVVAPWIMVDELVYSDMARSFAATGHFLIRGEPAHYGFVYPLLISPAYALFSAVPDAYTAIRVIDAPLMSLAAIPAYFLARRVLPRGLSLVAALAALLVPGMAYTGEVMTENAFYPLFLCVALALVMTLERPTVRRQVVLLALAVLAFLTRTQAVVLLPVLLTAPLALAWIERGRPRRLGEFRLLLGVPVAGAVLAVVVELARGRSPLDVLGNYRVTGHAHYGFWSVVRWVLLHVAELDLALWVLPFCAAIVLVGVARHLDRPVRALAAATATLGVWFVLQVGAFATLPGVQRIEERNLFFLFPLAVIALLVWIERGMPRPPRLALVAAGLGAALPGALPFFSLINISSQSDTIGFQPWWLLQQRVVGRASLPLVVVATCVVLAGLFLLLSRRFAPLLVGAVLLGFALTAIAVETWEHSFPKISVGAYFQGMRDQQRDWIDRNVGRDANVAVLWTDRGNPFSVWENEFFNRSVRRVYSLSGKLGGDMPEQRVAVDRATGILSAGGRPIDGRYVLTDGSVQLLGTPVARDAARDIVLVRAAQPVRLATRIAGMWPGDDRWSKPEVVWTREACRGGTLRVGLRTDAGTFASGQTVRFDNGRTVKLSKARQSAQVAIPLVPRAGRCTVTFHVTPSVVPAKVPRLHSGDTRLLGTHVDFFKYTPPR